MSNAPSLLLPVALIVLGTGWLLSVWGVFPAINWLWTLSLAAIGLSVFVAGGLNKFTVVVGPMFLAASAMSVLRQTGRLSIDAEVPLLVILSGVLLLVARSSRVPMPNWIEQPDPRR